MKERKYYQGFFTPRFPEKYKGDVKNIVFRSGWERKLMSWLDENNNVLEWNSEEIIIPYVSPIDGKRHRYFPDFYMKAITKDGTIKETLMEVKPATQTKPPKQPKRKTKQYLTEVMTWGVNSAKWEAAKNYCGDRGWSFVVVTENELFPRKVKNG